ncbi:phosphomevalonate kinase [Phlyctochytrium bullatum]|nr:phosphomevalonate kinase [Phlyctochytrium bullatum]
MLMAERSRTVSASGKVLITGGYLVLERQYSGLVVGSSSRFFTTVGKLSNSTSPFKIEVRSPQFLDGSWDYELHAPSDASTESCKVSLLGFD